MTDAQFEQNRPGGATTRDHADPGPGVRPRNTAPMLVLPLAVSAVLAAMLFLTVVQLK